ncbi:hypothetical protein [Streptomyces sp. NPDC058291]|uniref:hypothetical protein n=1 Tax=Streptomyces sp. NPDC058291 TaxID=3346427 RepID=UPI0036ECF67C
MQSIKQIPSGTTAAVARGAAGPTPERHRRGRHLRARSLRSGFLALVAATAVLAGGSQAVAAQPLSQAKTVSSHAPAPATALARVYLTTVIDQWTHYTPDSRTSSHAGTLYRGLSYFYCYTAGELYSNNGRTSGWWLLTDDDTGHRNVWVNEVNLDDYGWEHDIELLPRC